MRIKRRYQACLLTLSILLASLPVSGNIAPRAAAPAQTPPQTSEQFRFDKVDLDLLAQINLLDQRFEKEGLVYHEAAFEAYLDRAGRQTQLRCEDVEGAGQANQRRVFGNARWRELA